MVLNLSYENGQPLNFLQGLPNDYKGRILPGSISWSCIEDYGRLIIQELHAELYSISFQSFQFFKPAILQWKAHVPRPFSCFALTNDLSEIIAGYGKIRIRQGQVNFQGKDIDGGLVSYQKGNFYESLYTGYEHSILEGFDPGSITRPQWAGKGLLQWVDHIFMDEIRADFRRQYYETKVKEYLLLQFGNVVRERQKDSGLHPHELAAVYETLQIISRDMKEHIPIDELARRIGLKNFHLKSIFLRRMGMNIYEYQLYRKMMEARRLLLNSDKGEKEIASILGYSGTASLTTAFRKYFKITPSTLRDQHPKE